MDDPNRIVTALPVAVAQLGVIATKKYLRERATEQVHENIRHQQDLCTALVQFVLLRQFHTIFAFTPRLDRSESIFQAEPDITEALRELVSRHVLVVLGKDLGDDLMGVYSVDSKNVNRLDARTLLVQKPSGILSEHVAERVDAWFMSSVAWDQQPDAPRRFYTLGNGLGGNDDVVGMVRSTRTTGSKNIFAVGYDHQRGTVPLEPRDQWYDGIVTDSGFKS